MREAAPEERFSLPRPSAPLATLRTRPTLKPHSAKKPVMFRLEDNVLEIIALIRKG